MLEIKVMVVTGDMAVATMAMIYDIVQCLPTRGSWSPKIPKSY